jgi:hypothetical protein
MFEGGRACGRWNHFKEQTLISVNRQTTEPEGDTMTSFISRRATLVSVLASSSLLSLSASLVHAGDSGTIYMDPIAMAYIAGQCEIPISPAHTNWLDDVKRANYRADIAESEEVGAQTLKMNVHLQGRHRACQNFRTTLAHMGWL